MRKPNDQCTVCDKPIYRRPSDKERYPVGYCSEHKSQIYRKAALQGAETRYNNYISRWQQGIEDGMKGKASISEHIRKYMFEKCCNKCQKCGWSEVNLTTKRIPLEINHKDGNYRNNIEENLELLCPNCHSLTSSYRSLNRGNGRPREGTAEWLATRFEPVGGVTPGRSIRLPSAKE